MKVYQLSLVMCMISLAIVHNSVLPISAKAKQNLISEANTYMQTADGQRNGIEPWIQQNKAKFGSDTGLIEAIRNRRYPVAPRTLPPRMPIAKLSLNNNENPHKVENPYLRAVAAYEKLGPYLKNNAYNKTDKE